MQTGLNFMPLYDLRTIWIEVKFARQMSLHLLYTVSPCANKLYGGLTQFRKEFIL